MTCCLTIVGGVRERLVVTRRGRRRTFATWLMAFGFAATFVGQVAGFHVSHEVGAAVRSHQDASLVLAHHHYIFPMLTHYANLSGLWATAAGMASHAAASR
jgi:hypothetical protein